MKRKSTQYILLLVSLALALVIGALPFFVINSFASLQEQRAEAAKESASGAERAGTDKNASPAPANDPSADAGALPYPGGDDGGEQAAKERIKALEDELERTLEEVTRSKNSLYKRIEAALADRESIESEALVKKVESDAETQLIELRLEVYNSIIAKFDAEISYRQTEIDVIDREFESIFVLFSERLRQNYEEGTPGTLELFLRSDSFADMQISSERMNEISRSDRETLEKLETIQRERLAKRAELDRFAAARQNAASRMESEQTELRAKLAESFRALGAEYENVSGRLHLSSIAGEDLERMDYRLSTAITFYYEHIADKIPKDYKLTEEYKRSEVMPGIITGMEEGSVMKGSEYFDEGENYLFPLPMKYYVRSGVVTKYGVSTYTGKNGEMISAYHSGIDIVCAKDTPVYACRSGVVMSADYNPSYGYYIDVLHSDGIVTRYAHCGKLLAVPGEEVIEGERIALAGSTGNCAGNMLHIELHLKNGAVDPANYIKMPTGSERDD